MCIGGGRAVPFASTQETIKTVANTDEHGMLYGIWKGGQPPLPLFCHRLAPGSRQKPAKALPCSQGGDGHRRLQRMHSFSPVLFATRLPGASEPHCQTENKVMSVNKLMGTRRLERSACEIWEEDQEYQRGNNSMEKPSRTRSVSHAVGSHPPAFSLATAESPGCIGRTDHSQNIFIEIETDRGRLLV